MPEYDMPIGSTAGALMWVPPPATTTSPGQPGQVAYDSENFYVCIAVNQWRSSVLDNVS